MDTRFLDTLASVISHGSIAETARQSNLTPAAVAQRIRSLENEFGTQLIRRSGKTVKPTEHGLAIAREGLVLLQQEKSLKALANKDHMRGELRVGGISSAFQGILPEVIASVIDEYPEVNFYLLEGTSTDLYREVEADRLDAAIIIEPRFTLSKSLKWLTIREEPLILIVPEDLPDTPVEELLTTHPFIRYDRTQWGGRLVELYLRDAGIHPKDWIELDALDAIAAFVSRGLGVAVVPDWAPPWPAGLKIRRIALPDQHYTRRIGVVWKHMSMRSKLIQVLTDKARAATASNVDRRRPA